MGNLIQYVDLSNLPRNNNYVDWKNSIGYVLKFSYRGIDGTVEIIDYRKINNVKYVIFKYKDTEYKLQPSCFIKCTFGKLLHNELKYKKYKYELGDIVNNSKGNFTIIDRFIEEKTIINKNKEINITIRKYKYKCNKCGYEDIRAEHEISERACNACYKVPRKVVVGINDIPTIAPWMIPYFPNGEEEAKKYNAHSNKRIIMRCPYCGKLTKTKKSINALNRNHGFLCECSDGISYPNKFSYELLNQLPVENIIHEWQPDWLKPYYFDNYFEYSGKSYVLEMDGILGHGNRTWNMEIDTDGIQKDKTKDSLAQGNNVEVIRINACKSSLEYLKNEITNSKLNILFDLSFIRWDECDKFAQKNIAKVICNDKHMNPKMLTSELVEKYGLSRITIGNYLRLGSKYGWCDYDPNWNKGYIAFQRDSKPVICNDKYIFESISTLYSESEDILGVKVGSRQFHNVIKKITSDYKGLKFAYLDKSLLNEYIKNDDYIFIANKKFGNKDILKVS